MKPVFTYSLKRRESVMACWTAYRELDGVGDGFTVEVIEVGAMDEEEFDTLPFETAAWDRGARGFMIGGDNLQAVATGPFSRLQALRAVGAVMRQAGIPCERITHKNGAEFFTPVTG